MAACAATSSIVAVVGKVDFRPGALQENIAALLAALVAARPMAKGAKGGSTAKFIRSISLSTTMGKSSLPVTLASAVPVPSRGR